MFHACFASVEQNICSNESGMVSSKFKLSVGMGVLKQYSSTKRKSSTFVWFRQNPSVADKTDAYRTLNSLDFIFELLHILNLSVDFFFWF
jgi:hypothetical protein